MAPRSDIFAETEVCFLLKGSEQGGAEPSRQKLAAARRLLYLSHFFNQFSENSWQFCLILFLAAFSNYQSLVLVSSYGLLSCSAVCYFGSAAGRFIDGANRLLVAQRFIGLENCSVLAATICCYILLARPSEDISLGSDHEGTRLQGVPTDPLSIFLLLCIHILGAVASLLDSGFLVAVERDWIVVMSKCLKRDEGDTLIEQTKRQQDWLSDTNVTMKQIDLSCKILAPAIAGFFISLFDDGSSQNHGSNLKGAALFVGGLNAMALIVEYMCTAKIYEDIPALSIKANSLPVSTDSSHNIDTVITSKGRNPSCFRLPDGLEVYLDQDVSWAGIGLSLLYLNVLSFGGIMTAYLVWRGMRLDAIGLWRGVSAAAGLTGTFVYHFMSRRMTIIESGMWSIVFQFFCLSLSYSSLFVDDLTTSMAMLIAGVCASRMGLWVFDISVTELMQLHIPEDVRGLVGGVQKSLNAFFFMLSFGLGLLVPDPQYFHVYVTAGYVGVGLAVICFGFGVFARRRRLSLVQIN